MNERSHPAVHDAFETFLALEAASWKQHDSMVTVCAKAL
jgi:hypothetical protein